MVTTFNVHPTWPYDEVQFQSLVTKVKGSAKDFITLTIKAGVTEITIFKPSREGLERLYSEIRRHLEE